MIIKYKENIKLTWSVIKEAIGKKITSNHFQKNIGGKKGNSNMKSIAENFNRYFTEIGQTLAKKVDSSSVNFHKYLEACNRTQPEKELAVNELKDAFFSLKLNKSPGYNEVSFNVVKKCFGSLHKPLLHIFNASLENGTFPDELKIARVTPIFKNGSDSDL